MVTWLPGPWQERIKLFILCWLKEKMRKRKGKGGWESPHVITHLPWVPCPRVWWESAPQVGDFAHSIWTFERHFSFKPKQQPLHIQETRHIAGWAADLQVKTHSQLATDLQVKTYSQLGNRAQDTQLARQQAPSQEKSRGNGMMGRGSRAGYRAVKFLNGGCLKVKKCVMSCCLWVLCWRRWQENVRPLCYIL